MYDAIIIGAGQAGNPLASALAKAGKQVALIEREAVGGTCVNRGCTPTKTMIASARVVYLAGRGADYGVQTGPVTVDMVKIRQRKRDIVDEFRSSSEASLEKTEQIDLIYGDAKFTGPQTVEIALRDGRTRSVTAALIFVNTGARPAVPKLDGLDQTPFLDSTSVMELGAVPEHLLILGGGYIALEFGQMFRRFGSRVSIIERSDQLLGHEDKDVAEEMAKILSEDGLEILLGAKAVKAAQSSGGVTLTVETKTDAKTLAGSHLLVAVGRTPNTDTLGLSAAGINTDEHGYIKVNEKLETSAAGIYALGDVKGGPAFTHISYDDYRIVEANLLKNGHRTMSDRPVPYTVFTDPQLGRVGLTETEAKKQGKSFQIAKIPMSRVARAEEMAETRGFMKAIVDTDTKQILGAAILGVEGGEVMAVLEVAMLGKLPYTALRDAVLAHPTLAESLNNLFMELDEEPLPPREDF
jgi:pyruvate/2-oxoglutarate dehydrogenase complex dihydrolipoamide dehydrogenase (E3) component